MINEQTGAETTTMETANDMDNEELETYLSGNGNAEPEENVAELSGNTEKPEDPFQTDVSKEESVLSAVEEKNAKAENSEGVESDDASKENEEFSNMVDYLNKEHDLGLSTSNLPDDLTREQEAEVVSDLFKKTLSGVNRKLSEYSDVDKILQDEEVKNFIAAKAEGKSLKDYVKDFAGTIDGQDSASILTEQLSTQNPEMTLEEIKDLIETYREKNILDKMADSARVLQKEAIQAQSDAEAAKQQRDIDAEVQVFGKLVQGTTSVYGIPLTDQIKKDVFVAATQQDETGSTYMDKMLQSDEGMFLATLGVLHMQELMKAKASTNTNRANKKLVDKLFEKASDLQSNTEDTTQERTFNADFANKF